MLIDIVKNRRSVREYEDKDVPDEIILELIEDARLAPSAKNLQDWKFIIVKNKERRQKLVEAAKNQKFVGEAPVVIAGVATKTDYVMTNGIPACHIDLAIAMEHIALSAAEKGLGTCWIGAFYQDKAKEILKVPENCKIIALMTLGYPKDKAKEKIRKSIDEIVCWEEFK